eukprot:CAMPEP_0202726206 /NCGR_PEP_ID=MMETSP1385-20130828/184491_1 /ASSEMBLY_ACC=CAM_ASM_000861 /TAXON_ID=933848 /ORGANISM="Elphidium margaritaceum" /LENGTH=460 /DNA_ID=CAMNT_0049392421 /DNA_START=39 /DNA_END=1422 /DNA_ORIENTATION=+
MADIEEEVFDSEDFKQKDDAKNDEAEDAVNEQAQQDADPNVIDERIVPSKAFQIYAGQIYDPSSLPQQSGQAMRVYDNTEKMDTRFESPLQTYKRLQFEINEFQEKLQQIASKAKKEQQDPTKQITQQLSKELTDLWSNVAAFQNDPQIAGLFAEANSAMLDTVSADYLFKRLQEFQAQKLDSDDQKQNQQQQQPQNGDNKAVFRCIMPQIAGLFAEANSAMLDTVSADYLFKRLQEFQAQKLDSDDQKQNQQQQQPQNGDNKAVFTLYHDGSMNHQSYRMKEISERLATLEKIIGPKPDTPTVGDMTRTVEYLSNVLSLLSDDFKLEALVRRAHKLRKQLGEIQTKGHEAIEIQITKTKEEKINKLFEMMTRWDQAALQLPTIVSRLRSIKNLHEESANIVEKVNRLDTQNKLIQQTLESNKNILASVQQSLQENAQTMQNNMKLIQERLQKITQKLGV